MLQATGVDHHFTDDIYDIQKRQYRCPEVLPVARWGPSVDIWSVACVVRSFSPSGLRASVDDFLSSYLNSLPAGITSLTRRRGRGTARMRIIWRRSPNFSANSHTPSRFRANAAHASSTEKVCSDSHQTRADSHPLAGKLRYIKKFRFWPLEDVLHDKYDFSRDTAQAIVSFLCLMLRLNPEKRAGAGELVRHQWLTGEEAELTWQNQDTLVEDTNRRTHPWRLQFLLSEKSNSRIGSLFQRHHGSQVPEVKHPRHGLTMANIDCQWRVLAKDGRITAECKADSRTRGGTKSVHDPTPSLMGYKERRVGIRLVR